jgi:hypothetical protein
MKSKLFRLLGVIAVVAMIATALVAPVAAMTGVTLAVGTTTISTATPYVVTFTTGATQPANAAAFVLTFDSGITVAAGTTATITTGGGLGTGPYASQAITVALVNAQVVTLSTVGLVNGTGDAGNIGAGAIIQLTLTGITNPSTVGTYGVTVKSAVETTGVYSNTITTTIPTTPPLPGVASVYNSAGIFMNQYNSLNSALGFVIAQSLSGATIKLTAGTYGIGADALTGAYPVAVTITGTDPSAANVIIKASAAWSLTGTTVAINTLTVDASAGGLLTVGGGATTSATVTGCNFTGGVLTMAAAGASATNTVATCTFTTKNAAVGLTTGVATTVTGSSFNTAAGGTGIMTTAGNLTASTDTFTGTATTTIADYGISLTGGTSTISTSTFTNLYTALTFNGAGLTFNGNTVTACGNVTPAASSLVVTAVTGTTANFYNNTITGGLSYIISVAANANMVNVMDNTFGTNAKAASSADAVNTLNVTRNYWGGSANNPASVTTAPMISYANPLGAALTASVFATSGTSLTAAATVGVNFSNVAGYTSFGAAALSADPVGPTLPSNVTLIKYFDVYANGTGAGSTATVDFYGTTASPVNSNTGLYFYNAAFGTWSQVTSASLNAFAGYCEVVLPGTPGPSWVQFSGCAFALVSIPTTLGNVNPTATPLYPVNGAVNVPITNMTFTWPAVAGTGVTYQFALAQASANTSANEFAILDYSDNTLTNAEPSQETLQYNTVYWWEVRAVTLNSSGAVAATGPWSIQMFTTMPQPVATTSTAAPTTVVTSVVITQPVTTVVSTQTSVVITQTTGNSTPAIPSYLLWAVIAVGAVLIIAVIVLIVRTRRIP